MYIETINSPEDVKKLTIEELPALAEEMRHALLTRASRHGGHFGPNFGMVEATIAMHYVFESPKDKIVYDVSHQSYPHKMLTGRKDAYLMKSITMMYPVIQIRLRGSMISLQSVIHLLLSVLPVDLQKQEI